MATISLKDLDKLIESALTNVTPLSQNPIATPSKIDDEDETSKPMNDFLQKVEKDETDAIQFNNKLKSLITDPNQRKSKETQIAQSKVKIQAVKKLQTDFQNHQKQSQLAQMEKEKKMQDEFMKMQAEKSRIEQMLRMQVRESFAANKFDALPIMKKTFPHIEEAIPAAPIPASDAMPQQAIIPQQAVIPKKTLKVTFDSKTAQPYEVSFTERGFLIGNTRLSFEVIETALSKNFNITLDGGTGMVLDAIKMQKILKYKDKV